MAQRSHVPAFGNWEKEGNVPYTVFFDKARKGKAGGPIRNPNDPEAEPEREQEREPDQPTTTRQGTVKPTTHERKQSRELDGGLRQLYSNSPGHRDNPGRRGSGEVHAHLRDQSIDRSPLHRQAQPKASSGKDSPSWEGRGFETGGHGNPGKTRLNPNPRDTKPESTAVPKFGSWDVNNPASADGFTHIFNQVREERKGPPPGSLPPNQSSPYNNVKNQRPQDSVKSRCCPWF